MHNGEAATKPRSLLWKSATDCTRFDWRIWICKSWREQLMIWNEFSPRTSASPCSHVVSVDEIRLWSNRHRNWGQNKVDEGHHSQLDVPVARNLLLVVASPCCQSCSAPQILVHVKVYFLQLLLFWHDGESRQLKLVLLLVWNREVMPCGTVGDFWGLCCGDFGDCVNSAKKKEGRWKSK